MCAWMASEHSERGSSDRTFLAQFSSTDVALEFKSIFDEVGLSIYYCSYLFYLHFLFV